MTDNTDALPPLPASQAFSLTRSVYTADDMHATPSPPRDAEIAKLRQGEPVAPPRTDRVLVTIGMLLAEAMDKAVAAGANSVSMPDEYVELAAWLASPPPAQPSQNPWRDAIDEALVVAHLGVATEPYDDLNRLLEWHHDVWLDPAVSSDAQALIDRGAAEERQRTAQPAQTFEQAWAEKEADGYRYGKEPLANVRLGWDMACKAGASPQPCACNASLRLFAYSGGADDAGLYGRLWVNVEGESAEYVRAAQPAQAEFHNPWRTSLENCISGDNYLRASEYRDLIEELDELYRLRAAQPPREPVQPLSDEDMTNCGLLSELRLEEERRAEWHAEMRRDAFGDKT